VRIQVTVHKSGFGTPGIAKQVAFATALAMNRTLDEGQVQERLGIAQRFTVRRPQFINRLVKRRRDDFARPDRLIARLRIEGPEGAEQRGMILGRHEIGGEHTGRATGVTDVVSQIAGYFFLPADVTRPSKQTSVQRALYPANLRLVARKDIVGTLQAKVHRTKSGRIQLKGKLRTFVLMERGTSRPLGIYQRDGGKGAPQERHYYRAPGTGRFVSIGARRKENDVQIVWTFNKRIHLSPRLQFFATQQANFDQRYAANFRGFMSFAVRTSR
jgi:hypothetical protein